MSFFPSSLNMYFKSTKPTIKGKLRGESVAIKRLGSTTENEINDIDVASRFRRECMLLGIKKNLIVLSSNID